MSKDSSIKVFAENVGDTNPRPVNNIPVWIENVSAIGGGGGGGDIPSEVSGKWEDASNCVQTNSASWGGGSVSLPITGSSNYTTATYDTNSALFDYNETQGEPTHNKISINPDPNEGFITIYNSSDEDETNTTLTISDSYIQFKDAEDNLQEIDGASVASWNDTYSTVQSNSASWGQGGGSTGDLSSKLDASAVGFRSYAGTTYVSGISGRQISARYAQNAYNADVAQTAYYDGNGNYLSQTHDDLTALNNFVANNSANWGGGSTGSSGSLLIHDYYSNYDGENSAKSISGAVDYYFEAYVDVNAGTPSEMILLYHGGEAGRIPWVQVSSDGYQNYFTASYNNFDGNEISFGNNGFTNYNMCQVSADGVQTNPFYPDGYHCDTQTTVKFNIQGSNITGDIWADNGHGQIPLTSFTGGLNDFTATGYIRYGYNISPEDATNNYNYDVSAEFGGTGGSTVTSGDVLPPVPTGTGNTYALYWNDANGLFWDMR